MKSCVGYVGETNRHPVIPPVSGLETAEFHSLLGIQRHTCIGNNLGINYQKYGENDQT